MSFAETALLGALAGVTIYLSLPLGRLELVGARTRVALAMFSVGILVFLLVRLIPGDPVTDGMEAAELLDIDVDELARMLALVAPHRFGGIEILEAAQAGGFEDAADGGGRDADRFGDVLP